MGLALVAAVRGYKMVFTITDKQSKEKCGFAEGAGRGSDCMSRQRLSRTIRAVIIPWRKNWRGKFRIHSIRTSMTPDESGSTLPDDRTEIWGGFRRKDYAFVCGMGTGGTISGVGRYLKEKNPKVKIIGVDPEGSLYYDCSKTSQVVKAKTYVVEGIGEDFFPTTMNMKILDDVIQVNDEECFVVARRLVKLEGIFTGGSGGGCISGAMRLAKDLGAGGFCGGVHAGYGHAVFEQGVQRRVDARARVRGVRRCRLRRGDCQREAQPQEKCVSW